MDLPQIINKTLLLDVKLAVISKKEKNSSVCLLGGDSIVFERRNTKGMTDPTVH